MADDPWSSLTRELTYEWIRSPSSCHEQLFISLVSWTVSYQLTHRRLAAWLSQPSFRCFTSSSDNTEELPWGVYCARGLASKQRQRKLKQSDMALHWSTCHRYWWIAHCDPSHRQTMTERIIFPVWPSLTHAHSPPVPVLAIHTFTFPVSVSAPTPTLSGVNPRVWSVVWIFWLMDCSLEEELACCLTDTPECIKSSNGCAAGC